MDKDSLTVADKIVIAAATFRGTFSLSELCVKAYETFPETFGLAGFEDRYLDNNKILVELSGQRGLVTAGYFERPKPKHYRITDAGHVKAEELQAGARGRVLRPRRLALDLQARLDKLWRASACTKVSGGMVQSVLPKEAAAFLALDPVGTVAAARAAATGDRVLVSDGEVSTERLDAIERCERAVQPMFKRKLQTVGV